MTRSLAGDWLYSSAWVVLAAWVLASLLTPGPCAWLVVNWRRGIGICSAPACRRGQSGTRLEYELARTNGPAAGGRGSRRQGAA